MQIAVFIRCQDSLVFSNGEESSRNNTRFPPLHLHTLVGLQEDKFYVMLRKARMFNRANSNFYCVVGNVDHRYMFFTSSVRGIRDELCSHRQFLVRYNYLIINLVKLHLYSPLPTV